MSAFMHIHLHEVAVLGNSHMVCEVKPHNITPGEAAMADAVGKAVKAIDPHALPPFHEEYAVKMHGHVWKGDSEEDFELLKTYEGARKIVDRLESDDLMQGFWDHPKRTIVRRVVGEWEDAQ
jgi:hypothetical protein